MLASGASSFRNRRAVIGIKNRLPQTTSMTQKRFLIERSFCCFLINIGKGQTDRIQVGRAADPNGKTPAGGTEDAPPCPLSLSQAPGVTTNTKMTCRAPEVCEPGAKALKSGGPGPRA